MPTYTNDLVISKSTSATNTPAVRGESKVFEGVHGISHGTHGGVVGVNDDISTDPAKPAGPGVSGSATSGVGIIGTSDTGIGMWGHSKASTGTGGVSENGIGVHGISANGPAGVRGDCAAGVGVSANSVTGRAVEANSPQGTGVVGTSTSGVGVWGGSDSSSGVGGMSNSGHGVHGVSTSDHGVVGNSTSGRGVAGFSDSWQGVYGHSNSQAGVVGESDHFDGVFGISHNLTAAGVSGHNPGGLAGYFDGNVTVTGQVTCVDVNLTGQDYAENFDIAGSTPVEPGSVMVVDSEGTLRPCEIAYDKKCGGVISGAGAFKPGITLGKIESSGNRQPIALVGKVYCKADAGYGAIEVGDLSTTSPTPGHAMKTTDQHKAFGAVIGKALRPLSEGQGLIPVLIALQ